jgi:NAD-dependent SIR2 family protein deacetylase
MVRKSKYTVFFTGAGVSTSAGISDYRGPAGAWTQRRIRELEQLGEKRTTYEESELEKLVENRKIEQAKQSLEKSIVHLPINYGGEKVFEEQNGMWRLKDKEELSNEPRVSGIAYRRSKDAKDIVKNEGVYWGSFAPSPTVDEGDGWLRCEAELNPAKRNAAPTLAHMAQVTLMKRGLAKFVVTTNLDGLYRKAGLQAHEEVCFLHGDTYTERCTGCGYDFERNFHVRNKDLHVHDHHVGICCRCGSEAPANYVGEAKGNKTGARAERGFKDCGLIGTFDANVGTKDTHINFGECLDEVDLKEAHEHCSKADLCIVMGTSMSLRHITHFPFLAKKVVIVNLQMVPDDTNENKKRISLRLWAQCDPVCEGLLRRLNLDLAPVPHWLPRDAVEPEKLPPWLKQQHREEAIKLWEEVQSAPRSAA